MRETRIPSILSSRAQGNNASRMTGEKALHVASTQVLFQVQLPSIRSLDATVDQGNVWGWEGCIP